MQTILPKNPSHGTPLLLVCLFLVPFISQAQVTQSAQHEIHVFAADDLQPALTQLSNTFTHTTGIKLIVHYGTSAALATQLLAGDPADIFLATDYSIPEQIVAHHLADSPEPIPYARGTLVLWARKDSPLQPLTQNTLRDPHIQSLSIADPDHIPYGRAAVAALVWAKLYNQLKPHIITAPDLIQTQQLVESGKAQLGLISLTEASTPHSQQIGSFIRVPPSSYLEIRLCAVVLLKSSHIADAHLFLDWLRSPPIQGSIATYGLNPIQ